MTVDTKLGRELLAGTTPGPWTAINQPTASEFLSSVVSVQTSDETRVCIMDSEHERGDAAFITWARNNAEELLAAAEGCGDGDARKVAAWWYEVNDALQSAAHALFPDDLPASDLATVARMRTAITAAQARVGELETMGRKLNAIRDSIVGMQGFNFSEHAYPMVAALNEAGFVGLPYPEAMRNLGTLIEQRDAEKRRADELSYRVASVAEALGVPESESLSEAVRALRSRADEAEGKVSALADELKLVTAERDNATAKLSLVHAPAENVWHWQGDGEDHPETMATGLPVVMRVETLRVMLGRADEAKVKLAELSAERERVDASWLLTQGGKWLGAARNWLKWHKRNGDQVTWGSNDVLEGPFTVREVEDLAATVAAAAMAPQPNEKHLESMLRARWKAERERDAMRKALDEAARSLETVKGWKAPFDESEIADEVGLRAWAAGRAMAARAALAGKGG